MGPHLTDQDTPSAATKLRAVGRVESKPARAGKHGGRSGAGNAAHAIDGVDNDASRRPAYASSLVAITITPTTAKTAPSAGSMILPGTYLPTRVPIVPPIRTPGTDQATTCQTGVAAKA